MKTLCIFILTAAAGLQMSAAEMARSLFDLQLSHPKERWYAKGVTNQQSRTAGLMLMKDGKGKAVHISTEVQAPPIEPFNAADVKRIQDEVTATGHGTNSQKFTEFMGTRAYRIDAEGKDGGGFRGFSLTYYFYHSDKRYKVFAICFEGKKPEADKEISSILKSMKFAK